MLKKRFARKPIRSKLIVFLMLSAALSTVVTSIVFSAYELKTTKSTEISRIVSIADILAPSLTAALLFDDSDTAKELIAPFKKQAGIIDVIVLNKYGDVFYSSERRLSLTKPQIGSLNQITTPLSLDDTLHGELVVFSDDTVVAKHVSFYIKTLVSMLLFSLFVSLIVSLYLSRIFTNPILSLADIANRVTKSNDYTLRARTTNQDELGALTDCFNSMLETIDEREQVLEFQVQERTNQLEIANTQLKVANNQLTEQAFHDPLSNLPNRRYLLERMDDLIKDPSVHAFSLMYLDLDGFKIINDSLGHDAGDELIKLATIRIRDAIRSEDTLARLGGDEFTVLLNEECSREVLSQIADNIRFQLTKPFFIKDEQVRVTASIGISCYPEAGNAADDVVKKADIAMYVAKDEGRNTFRFFEPPMLQKVQNKKRMLDDLRKGLEKGEFEVYYQPIMNLATGNMDKVESLIRWNHPGLGQVLPVDFITLAEETGLINEIGIWVSETAIASIKRLRRQYDSNLKVAINVSPHQFKRESEWLVCFHDSMKKYDVDERAVTLEITEHLLMSSDDYTLNLLKELKDIGIEIAIDDFGVGYSSLSYLQQMKTDVLKIDRSFVQSMQYDAASQTLCQTIIIMARNLGMKVVAEGIETKEQLELLTSYGCHYGQGFYLASPMNYQDLERVLQRKLTVE
ncbi:EAL domain-containing protein [Vibrio tapetis subsp. quintayensis]|uniref:EAL domain-containing protein n=1 Tax=Vibrio tapetis TaxID=52443 RepID=UPI0025B2996F|nr:EAL domain-containing protein [Vibrio tapetis]MDN3682816.1 EAL domain-containing protein [Vibrio tapetis subsp. quintayensis]